MNIEPTEGMRVHLLSGSDEYVLAHLDGEWWYEGHTLPGDDNSNGTEAYDPSSNETILSVFFLEPGTITTVWEPLDVPKVNQRIRAVLRGGGAVLGEVNNLREYDDCSFWSLGPVRYHFNHSGRCAETDTPEIVSWEPVQPKEPTKIGAVVYAGPEAHVRVPGFGYEDRPWVMTGQGIRSSWDELLALNVQLTVKED